MNGSRPCRRSPSVRTGLDSSVCCVGTGCSGLRIIIGSIVVVVLRHREGPGLRGSHGRAGTARSARELDVRRLVAAALGVGRRGAGRGAGGGGPPPPPPPP